MTRLMKWLKRVSCKASISAQPIWWDESKAAKSQDGYTNMPCGRCTATMTSARSTTTTATTNTKDKPGRIGITPRAPLGALFLYGDVAPGLDWLARKVQFLS